MPRVPQYLFECSGDLQNVVAINLLVQQKDVITTLSFIIDTGSDITALKSNKIIFNDVVNQNNALSIYGITSNSTKTKGSCEFDILIEDEKINQTFHVLNDDVPIKTDGILGNDFLRTHNCQISYQDYTLSLGNHAIPLACLNSDSIELNELTLKPRTETVIAVNITNPTVGQGIIPKTELQSGVYLASSVIQVTTDFKALTTILNTLDEEVKIKPINIEIEPYIIKQEESHFIGHISKQQKQIDRFELLKSSLRLDHLSEEERLSITQICMEYNSIFHLDGDQLPETTVITHKIETTTQVPIASKTYRYPHVHKDEVHKQINHLLDQGIIRPSTSPWSAPIWVVPKKKDASGETKWRVVVDYRGLNSVTIQDNHPLINITDILDKLGKAKYFSCLDCYSGFHSVKLCDKDAQKTAFSTDLGHYEFVRMPFGLKNAPATYQRLMNTVLSGLQGSRVFVYMDDLIIFGTNLSDHNNKLIEVFKRLKTNSLKLNPLKCEFLRKEVAFLGHTITHSGVKPNPDKINCVVNYPIPKNIKDIQAFLGLCNYYRKFIKDFAAITKPLTELTKKNVPFLWTDKQQYAFEILKQKLSTDPILQYPDFTKPFVLTTDASGYAISGILSQGTIPNDLPIAYASRTLNKAELNYATIEKELLAIVWSVKYFRPYLYGQRFTIYTDHKPLVYLFRVKDPGSRLVRWRLLLEEYDYSIIYKPGKNNTNSDALSRAITDSDLDTDPKKHLLSIQADDSHNLTFNDFLKENQSKIIINNNVTELNKCISKANDNIVIPISQDYDTTSNKLFRETNQKTNHLQDIQKFNPTLNNVIALPHGDKEIYYTVMKHTEHDKLQYETIFESLKILKEYLVNNNIQSISLQKLGSKEGLNWPQIRTIIRYIFRGTNIKITIYLNERTTPDSTQINQILEENHSSPQGGHFGFHKVYNKIKQQYYWTNMKQDIKTFIQNCKSCQENKLIRKKHKEPMVITDTPNQAFEKVSLDIVGPLSITESGNKYILTIQDNLTKFSQAYPMKNQEAETVAKTFVNNFICQFALPKQILTDQGTNFTSNLFKSMAKLFKLKHVQTTAYHPESNGALERTHHTLTQYLRHYINNQQSNWDEWIPMATFSFNTSVHSSTKFTPYELVFGFSPTLPTSITQKPEFKYTYDDYIEDLKLKLNTSNLIAKQNLIKSKETNKKYYDKNTSHEIYKIGDLVYLVNESIIPSTSKKLNPTYAGPYEIISVDSPVNVTLKVKRRNLKVHTNRIKHAFVSEHH